MIAKAKIVAALLGAHLLLGQVKAVTSVNLAWDASPSSPAGYVVYSLVQGSSQTNITDVGNVTNAIVQNLAEGQNYTFYVTAYNSNRVESDPSNTINFINASGAGGSTNSPRFLQADVSTRGNWKGVYGSEGNWLATVTPQLPPYASVSTTNSQWTWTTSPSSPSAPLLPGDTTNRIAACWYSSTALNFAFNINDGQFHRVSIYFLDWTASGRRGQVEVFDLPSGQVFDTRGLSNYSNGIYLTWQLSGAVGIRFISQNVNAVASAIFFDPATNPAPANRSPTLQPIADQAADEGQELRITLQASDPDPGQTLRYSLGTNVPAGATINTNTGVFSWTPTASQAPSTNQITLIATDSGAPAMSAQQTFTAVVRPAPILNVATASSKGTVQVNPRGTLNPEGTKYVYGTSVSATAQAQNGAYFSYWTLNGATYTQNPLSFQMNGNQSLTANFNKGGGGIKLTSATSQPVASSSVTSTTTSALSTTSATAEPTNTYVLESSTNLVEWDAITNVVATTDLDTNSVFRIRAATAQ